jgi:hypothetical protein
MIALKCIFGIHESYIWPSLIPAGCQCYYNLLLDAINLSFMSSVLCNDKIDFNVYGQDSLDTITQLNFQLYLWSNDTLDNVCGHSN